MIEAYVPPGRRPFLPFECRSGWELLVHLEKYGCKVRNYNIRPEEDIISECLAFMQTERFLSHIPVTGAA
jgi:hypothetical protein